MSKENGEKTSDELAQDRTELAELRNDYAENRTLQAAERTYAAWTRTGFTLAGAGWTLGKALEDTETRGIALLLGGALIFLGILCFVYGWFGFKSVFKFLKKTSVAQGERQYSFMRNLVVITVLSITLIIIFIAGFGLLIF